MKDKLAEEILSKHLSPEYLALDGSWLLYPCIQAMQAYHKAKMNKEVRKCGGCGSPLNDYCERCQHLWES